MTLTLAIDQGTHASRAVLFDEDGQQLDIEFQEVSLHRRDSGWVEQDSAQLRDSVVLCCRNLLSRVPAALREDIGQCGIATQRSSLVPCDLEGNALGPVLSWQDSRGASLIASLRPHGQLIQAISGLPLSPHYGATKMQWMLGSYQKGELVFAPLASYLLKQLVNPNAFVVDHGNAQRTQLMSLESTDWSMRLLDLFKIPVERLPACVPVRHAYGDLLDLNIPVTAVTGDQNAALFSGGEPAPDTAYINIGSGAFVLVPTESAVVSPSLLTSIAYSNSNRTQYFKEGTVNGAGAALNWMCEQSGVADWWELLPDWLEQVSEPPLFINGVGGIGSPWWRVDVDSQFIGTGGAAVISDSAERRAVAVVESIVFLIQNNLDAMPKQHGVKQIYVSGGVSRLDGLCERLANLSGVAVHRFNDQESTAKGIAWLARQDRPGWSRSVDRVFSPAGDESLRRRYVRFTEYLESL